MIIFFELILYLLCYVIYENIEEITKAYGTRCYEKI